ncbi:efflux RND transporter permease subunit [Bradymonas sediminis]|uniref:AcrB/AcrD/AcrF family protein n=1 Tax=Bradymonas sediminis TaxID=1548548 RepID=A0A2Z4FMX2_9DELT|nr:efflux RND transporter permease subunit [Bradymonas sediminis]AWV90272.1 AcrB/AcrD/AcrF family protein [Bradymonas sediminis]TDP75760.1 HAE1 family hydrophobic/amphiphilic exporter-1 [Bradymonas sediminis]
MKLSDVSVTRPVFTTMMILALFVFGIWAYPKVGVDEYPEVEFPFVTVMTIYPGADPGSVETKVIDVLEEAINSVSGIEELRSTSSENVGMVMVQFELDRDVDQAVQDVRDKVASVLGDLPEDIDPPIIQKFDIGAAPILSLVVSGPESVRELTRIADEVVKTRIQTIQGVGNIDIVGGQEREFQVKLDPIALQRYGIAVEDVAQTIGAQNIAIPGGRVEYGGAEFSIKTEGEVFSAAELGNLVIAKISGRVVRVSDVADVQDAQEEKRSHAALNGESAVSLTIQKQSGGNTVEVAKLVREEIEEIRPLLGEGIELTVPVDNSVRIEASIDAVKFDLVFGAILAILIIMLFLRDWRATFISALALPTSVIATVAFIYMMGFTFNTMTMLAMTLSIGILIDDAIVVIENIHRHLEMGKSAIQAALDGTAEIGLAVLAITASLVAVFVPVATMKGILGRFFFQFGLTVAFAVTISLFVAFTITPMLSARMLKVEHKQGKISAMIEKIMVAIDNIYEKIVNFALRHTITTLALGIGSFVAAIALAGLIPFEFLPAEDNGEFEIFVEMPAGTPLETTMEYVETVTERVQAMPGVELTFATMGSGAQQEVHKGRIRVNLIDRSERSFTQNDAMEHVRKEVSSLKGAKIAVEPAGGIGGGGERQGDVQFLLLGNNYDELNESADRLIERLNAEGGFVDVDKSSRDGKPEVQILVDRERAAEFNVPVAMVGSAIRMLYAGQKVSEISTDGERYDVQVRLAEEHRLNPTEILDLTVRSTTGQLVPLSNIVEVREGTGPTQIDHFNRRRQVTVLANLEGLAMGDAIQLVNQVSEEVLLPGVRLELSGQAKNLAQSMGYMLEALILAIVLIYLILASQFESFVHPLTIMIALPLSFVGALGALLVTGMTLNIFTMIGFIMLMGLVTKNAVLLVDYANQLMREEGMSTFDALVRAGVVRLRPILMTTAAMIFGMTPVALGGDEKSAMAVAVIGGLITSTVLTLVVVPVVYLLMDKFTTFLKGLFGSSQDPDGPSGPEEELATA